MATKKSGQKRSTRHAGIPSRDANGWRIRWVDSDGKRRSRNFSGKNAYQKAIEELERIKGEVRAIKDGRTPAPKSSIKFVKFVEEYWIKNRTKKKRDPQSDYSIFNAHLKPAFGSMPLNQITTEKVERFSGQLHDLDLKPKTIRNILTLLGSVLRYGRDLDFLFRLPKINMPVVVQNDFAYLKTENQIRAFLTAAKDEGQDVNALFATALYTGMRAGELFGLPWDNVDFRNRLIKVDRSYDKPTKTGVIRHVPILDPLLPILRKWRLSNKHEFVFTNMFGQPHAKNPRVVRFTYPAVLKKAKLPRLRFHDLRHSFASQWVAKGGDLFALQKILGHASQQMVQRYAHLAPEAFEKYHGIFGESEPQSAKVSSINKGSARRSKR